MTIPEAPVSAVMDSPLGPLLLTAQDAGLTGVAFADGAGPARSAPEEAAPQAAAHVRAARLQLEQYFTGSLRAFSLTLAPRGTAFQREVWAALCRVPFGRTVSYGDIARVIGRPRASRAVGAANGSNPLAIVVPCHRVVGADGTLTGYGGGLERKRLLLALEGVAPGQGVLFG